MVGSQAATALRTSLRTWLIAAVSLVGIAAADADLPLIRAVERGDAAAVRALLSQRADVNAVNADGASALFIAVQRDDLKMVETLIAAGANVRTANRRGVPPLYLACINASPAVARLLLEAGADPHGALPEGETMLMAAARTGSLETVTLLLDRGVDVNARESWRGQTALMWAAAQEHPLVARRLVERGADVTIKSKGGFSALVFAVRSGNPESVRILLEAGGDVNDAASDGTSVLVVAIVNAHWELAASLLDRGADPNKGAPGSSPLHAAIRVRNPDMVALPDPVPTGSLGSFDLIKALVAHGANVNAPASKGQTSTFLNLTGATPFLLAAFKNDVTLMRFLREHGADPSIATSSGSTALMAAAGLGYDEGRHPDWSEAASLEAVKLVLDLGGDVNAVDANGNTALHGAAFTGALSVIKLLAGRGAKLDVTNKLGYLPVTIAEGIHIGALHKYRPEAGVLFRQLMSGSAQQP
jgi:ankyrin repeat protein